VTSSLPGAPLVLAGAESTDLGLEFACADLTPNQPKADQGTSITKNVAKIDSKPPRAILRSIGLSPAVSTSIEFLPITRWFAMFIHHFSYQKAESDISIIYNNFSPAFSPCGNRRFSPNQGD